MSTIKRTLATVAVAAGLLAAAAPAAVYQHNQTNLEFLAAKDGTSNTIQFG